MSSKSEVTLHSRGEWISASRFSPIGQREVFQEVSDRVQALRQPLPESGPHSPLVLLDLDSTLYEVSPRSFRILLEWMKSPDSERFPTVRERLKTLTEEEVGYSLRDTFRTLGLSLEDPNYFKAWEAAKQFWLNRFFTSEYLE